MNIPEKFTAVIPARYQSSRFPGKPLQVINGKSMISRVWHNANEAQMVDQAIVATDDERIYEHCKAEGCEVMYTSPECNDGSARVAEVAEKLDAPYIFELQGDQPLVTADLMDQYLKEAREAIVDNPEIDIVQPYATATEADINNETVVKVPISVSGRMLLISRQPIPCGYRTLGLYLWKRETLLKFPSMPISDYEKAETCHLLRFYLNDLYVQGVLLDDPDWIEVDLPEHISKVEEVMKKKGIN